MISDKPSLEDLAHFGVKGMKWGIRKEDPYKSTDSKSERKDARLSTEKFMSNAARHDTFLNYMTDEDFKSLTTKGQTFAKGTTLKRVQLNDSKTITGELFVSKMLEDHEFYKAVLPAYSPAAKFQPAGSKKYKSKVYELDLVTLNKLRAPSEKERFNAFMEILAKPAIRENNKAPVTGRQYLEKHGYKRLFRTQTDQQLAFSSYYSFVQGQGDQTSPLNRAYFDHLKSKGYNALQDGFDSGRYTKNPLIILDANKNVKLKSVRRLTANEINEAQRGLAKRTSLN